MSATNVMVIHSIVVETYQSKQMSTSWMHQKKSQEITRAKRDSSSGDHKCQHKFFFQIDPVDVEIFHCKNEKFDPLVA